MTRDEIPGPSFALALPSALKMLRDPRRFLTDGVARYGPVWRTFIPAGTSGDAADGRRFVDLVWLMGPAANERILAPPHKADFSSYGGYAFTMEAIFGPDILFLLEGPAHRARHRALQPAFHPRMDATYLPEIERITSEHLDRWRDGDEVNIGDAMRRLTFHIVARLFLGATDEELASLTHDFDEVGVGLYSVLRVAMPGFRFYRGLRARRKLAAYLAERIAGYRRTGLPENMLGELMRAVRPVAATPADPNDTADAASAGEPGDDAEPERLADESLIAEMLAFIFAGYDTTASMQTSLWVEVMRRPDLLARLTDEADRCAPAEVGDQPWLAATLLETERLHPPLLFSLRGVLRDFEFGGFRVRAGSKVAWSAWHTGRMASLFPEPEAFRPERFLDGKRPPPYSVLGFGGGHRACIGKRFALQEMQLVVSAVLRRFHLEPVANQSDAVFFTPTLQRRDGYRVRARRR